MTRRSATSRARSAVQREEGSALVEFVALAVLLLIPLTYLVLTLGQVQAASFAADSIVREVARIHATDSDEARAERRAASATRLILEDAGLDADPEDVVTVTCDEHPCRTAGNTVRVDARITAGLPGIGDRFTVATVTSSHALVVDRYILAAGGAGGSA